MTRTAARMVAVKAILFDLDGTLLDSERWHRRSEIEVLRDRFGVEVTEADLRPYTGRRLDELLAGLAPGVDHVAFAEAHAPVLRGYLEREMRLFGDARRCLSRLAGVAMALASSSPRWYVDAARTKFVELSVFSVCVAGDEVARGKPAPDLFLRAASALGVAPADCLVVEDAPSGVQAALSAGCMVVQVAREGPVDGAHDSVGSLDLLPNVPEP